MTMRHRLGSLLLPLLLAVITIPFAAGAADVSHAALEDDIKAVYIYNFIRFTEWPEKRESTHRSASLAIMGNLHLLKMFKSRGFQDASGSLELNTIACDTSVCAGQNQALFIDRSEKMELGRILRDLDSKPVLTISDIEGFADAGGMIELRREGERVMFRINLKAVRKSGLYISAQLLQLAEIVGEKP